MRKIVFLIIVIFGLILGNIFISFTHAQTTGCDISTLNQCDSIDSECGQKLKECSDQLNQALQMSINATKPAEDQLNSLQQQLAAIKDRIVAIGQNLALKKIQLDKSYADVAQKTQILNAKIRDFYIKSTYNSPILIFLSSNTASQLTEAMAYQRELAQQDKNVITNLVLSITDLEAKKKQLESENAQLAVLQSNLDDQTAKLDKLVSGAKAYQAVLSSQIAQLSAKQQQLIAAKLSSLNIPLFAYSTQGGCSSDIAPYKDPGFSGSKFGFFTYGVPNRVGLNQYGAWGRAKQGQDSDTILHAYYNFDSYQNMNATIRVNDGNGYDSGNIIWSGSLDEYVRRIYEVPDSWTDNNLAALKAQTIAARSYVMAETNNGAKSICANQNCQVFKTDPKGGNWDSAVSQTAGQVMVQGGQPITAYFSSTHGGYMFATQDIGWSATSFTKHAPDANGSITSFADLNSKAYDKDSPWFYCDWGGRSQYNNTAWLTSSDVTDIVNSILLVQNESSADSHILQPDKSDPEMWTPDQVRQELSKYRQPFNSISSISVSADFGSGQSTNVNFTGDSGTVSFDANTFRKYFNLRAPSNIQIVGPLFNVEIR